MSKRFTETTKWRDRWFRKLSPTSKLLWWYLTDNCDNAGVIDLDLEAASFDIGERVDEKNVGELGDRVEAMNNGKLWLRKFVPFQFGELSPESRVHQSILRLIASHGLTIPYDSPPKEHPKGIHTLKDKEKDTDKETEKVNGIGDARGKGFPVTVDDAIRQCSLIAVPPSHITHCFDKAASRGGKDARGVEVEDFPAYVRTEWKYHLDREGRSKSERTADKNQIQEHLKAPRI